MKHLTDDQLNAELERLKREKEQLSKERYRADKEQTKLWEEHDALDAERIRRIKQSLTSLTDRELVENLPSYGHWPR
jgi:hypothetical protein